MFQLVSKQCIGPISSERDKDSTVGLRLARLDVELLLKVGPFHGDQAYETFVESMHLLIVRRVSPTTVKSNDA